MEKKIYRVQINTTNPSADVNGYFDSKKKVDLEIERMKKVIENSPEYYGDRKDCNVEEDEIIISNKLE